MRSGLAALAIVVALGLALAECVSTGQVEIQPITTTTTTPRTLPEPCLEELRYLSAAQEIRQETGSWPQWMLDMDRHCEEAMGWR